MRHFNKLLNFLFLFLLIACGAPQEERSIESASQEIPKPVSEKEISDEIKSDSESMDKSLDFTNEELVFGEEDWGVEEASGEDLPILNPPSSPRAGKLAFYCPPEMTL